MGTSHSINASSIEVPIYEQSAVEPSNRVVHVAQISYKHSPRALWGRYMLCCMPFNACFPQITYTFRLHFGKYTWTFSTTFSKLLSLFRSLRRNYLLRSQMSSSEIDVLRKALRKQNMCCVSHKSSNFVQTRAEHMRTALQLLLDIDACWQNNAVREFLGVSTMSFNPTFGPKPIEFWAKKASGGFQEGYSNQWGDWMTMRTWRWFQLHKSFINWYASPSSPILKGTFAIQADLFISLVDQDIHYLMALGCCSCAVAILTRPRNVTIK